jgi:D-alanyl-D-alanine carboxypeptidase (penicillin-binding protein 5/6)
MHKKVSRILTVTCLLALIIGGYVFYCIGRTLPPVKPMLNYAALKSQPTTSHLAWPATNEAAVGVLGTSIISTNGAQTQLPTASTAKLVTALMILKAKPLSLGEQGPIITLTAGDIDIYNTYLGEDGSVVPVVAGEQISEYQLIEGMLLPSANNMADALAIWAYGSLANYSNDANKYVASLGLTGTHIGSDASGFLPDTVSTAADLVKIGELVMQNPLLKQIVSQPSASGIPVINSIKNVNYLLGKDNIVGIKTGNTDQAGGVFVGAATTTVDTKSHTLVTAYMGAPTLLDALNASKGLIVSAENNFQPVNVLKAGDVVAHYRAPWLKEPVPIMSGADFNSEAWGGDNYGAQVILNNLSYPNNNGAVVGNINDTGTEVVSPEASTVNAVLAKSVSKPSIVWRLLHP